ncbi:MAG: hypothetical protein UY49_C0008G0001, partial [Microgenomates group bacterium GW2011_GWC1_49_7]
FGEVVQKFTFLDRHIRVHATSVPPFSTIATGIWIAQFACVNSFPGLVVYANTAPRKELAGFKEEKTDGGRLVYTKLENGAVIIAVNTGYALSFVKPLLRKIHLVNVANTGSQFRSRDYYPDMVLALASGDTRFLDDEFDVSSIPDAPEDKIGFVVGYGNLKTTCRHAQCTVGVGTKVNITVGKETRVGVVADETYKVKDGDISWAAGSTGGTNRFMEIWLRGGSAWEAFGKPKVETEFHVSPAT